MALSLLKRLVKGSALTASEFDSNMTAVETAVNANTAKLADTVSVRDFGAKGDGATNDSAAIAAAVAYAVGKGNGVAPTIVWPAGTYKLNTGWTQPSWVHHVGTGGVVLDFTGLGAGGVGITVTNVGYAAGTLLNFGSEAPVIEGLGGQFFLKGPGDTTDRTGILMGNAVAQDVYRALRLTGFRNVGIEQFGVGIKILPVNTYLLIFDNFHVEGNQDNVWFAGASTDAMENTRFLNCVIATGKRAFRIESSGIDLTLVGCSINFVNDCAFYFATGDGAYNRVRMFGGHIEGATDRLGVVADDGAIGAFNRVYLNGVTFLPTTFTAQTRYGDTFPTARSRPDGAPSGIIWRTWGGGANDVELEVNNCEVRLFAINPHPAFAEPLGRAHAGRVRFRDLFFRHGNLYQQELGVLGPILNTNTGFTGAAVGAFAAVAGWSQFAATNHTAAWNQANRYTTTDNACLAVTGTGGGAGNKFVVQTPLLPVAPNQQFVSNALFNQGTGGDATLDLLGCEWFDQAGTSVLAEADRTNLLSTIYTDTGSPLFAAGVRNYWVREYRTQAWLAPAGASYARFRFGLANVNGTAYLERPHVARVM